MFGKIDIARTIAAAAVFVLVIYGAYFGLTYLESRQIFPKNDAVYMWQDEILVILKLII